jgi:hypothetical protein
MRLMTIFRSERPENTFIINDLCEKYSAKKQDESKGFLIFNAAPWLSHSLLEPGQSYPP